MPGFYPEDEYDLAGFSVGIVDQARILTPDLCRKGDVLIALASSGVHSNGFSLVRKVFDIEKADLNAYESELGRGLGETLLTPTKLYVKAALAAIAAGGVRSIAHITGGGFYENIPRALPEGLCAKIEKQAVEVLPIFRLIQKVGGIPERDMFNTFNMGVGMLMTVAKEKADGVLYALRESGEHAYVIGELAQGERGVELW